MLGAEGVKRAVIARLRTMMPVSLDIRRKLTGATIFDLPEVAHYSPYLVPSDMDVSRFPLITVTAEGTNGELSNQRRRVGSVVEEFEFEYTVLVQIHVMVDSQAGEPQARLRVERMALAVREALLGDTELDVPGDDEADVVFERWTEEYDATPPEDQGAWIADASLSVPIATVEHLDRAPYIQARQAVLESWDVEQLPTSTAFPDAA